MDERLKKFTVLVDAGTYTAAAKQLHTSQPALTTAIQKLERELHAELVIRTNHGLTLTPAGRAAYEQGRSLLRSRQDFVARLHELADEKRPLRLGSVDSIAELIVKARLLDGLEDKAEVSLQIQNSSVLLRQLEHGEFDMALIVAPAALPKGLVAESLGNERFGLVCSPAYFTAHHTDFEQGTIPNLLSYNPGSTTHALLNAQLQLNGLHATPRFYSTNPTILHLLAAQGKGVAALPYDMIRASLGTTLQELKTKRPLQRNIMAVREQARELPWYMQEFVEQIRALL